MVAKQEAAERLHPLIRLGTSSWTYPGWRDIVYRREYKSDRAFRAESLSEYAECSRFRTVGIDSFFYAPPTRKLLLRYAEQVPEGFMWVSKVWEQITIPRYARHKRYGAHAGKHNPDFLNAELFGNQVLEAFDEPTIFARTGPFVFQFQTITPAALPLDEFLDRLDRFLGAIPSKFRYAVEIRNESLLVPRYFQTLNRHGVTHCFNHWTAMPTLGTQMRSAAEAGGISAPFLVARLLTPRGVTYEDAVTRFEPYSAVREEIPEMRRDVVRLARRALQRGNTAFVIVNNRLEGCAPATIDALTQLIVEAQDDAVTGQTAEGDL